MDTLQTTRRILLVEDEPGLVITLSDMLKGHGYLVESVTNGLDAKDRILVDTFDLVVLDVMLPGMSGFDVCQRVREKGISTPILMLTARSETKDKVRGLRLGADDYLAKPFDPHELLARVEALLRRLAMENRSGDWFQFSNMKVDLKRGHVFRSDQRLAMSEREFALLRYLIERRGKVVSRDELLVQVWGYSSESASRTVDVHIAMLRQKVEHDPKNPQFIITVHAQGYRFVG
jgi:two-component system alkaline phosphatase synthesis response regulator PhoP